MSRSRSLLLAGALVAGALIPAAAAGAAPSDSANDRARAEHERIVAYWTPERMKAAIPRDFVRQSDGSFVLATPKGKPEGSGGKGKPGGSDGGGTDPAPAPSGVPVTAGSSWTTTDGTGGVVQQRTGKAYFRFTDAAGVDHGYVCSGSVVADSSSDTSLVLTAAHCVYDAEWGFATYWMFIPDFDSGPYLQSSGCNDRTSLGCWTAQGLVAHEGFTKAQGFTTEATQHDFAFAVVGMGGKSGQSRQLDQAVGAYELRLGGEVGDRMSAFGYPAAGKYKGNDLTFCSGAITTDPYNRYEGADDNWGMACKMTGGSSGGPWIVTDAASEDDGADTTLGADGAGGEISSLNSYGYTGVSSMFGPVFNGETGKVYSAAKAWSGASTVEVK